MHESSSSDESESSCRSQATANPGNTNDQEKKQKKKKRVPPQEKVDSIWNHFEKTGFHQPLVVLPSNPSSLPVNRHLSNELLSEGYNHAVTKCQDEVERLIKECKRVGLRYRDAAFDLDGDLRTKKGHCLNGLGPQMFKLVDKEASPRAVMRVHEIFEHPTFMGDINSGDVRQGDIGDCWLMGGLTALANVEGGINRNLAAHDTEIGIYGFVFYRDGEWIHTIIDDQLYLKAPFWDSKSIERQRLAEIHRENAEAVYHKIYHTGSKALFFARCADENETWVPLLQKAYAKAHGDYSALNGGCIGEGLEDLTGGVSKKFLTSDILDLDTFWDNEMSKVNQEFLIGVTTSPLADSYGERNGIMENHAYIVMDVKTLETGERLVKLRNPWGLIHQGVWEGRWSDGSREWTRETHEEVGHKFGGDSVFWISYEDMIRKYGYLERTRLFQDPNWRCSQRWIAVDVPWRPCFHERFRIKLTRNSPLILVLSQLDDRYFKGLRGQYSFELHFRLRQQGPSTKNFIVSCHENYLTGRSVSVELSDMPAGTYAVYLQTIGERDLSQDSVEAVLERECAKRTHNEKLAQVGKAYDLAHNKIRDYWIKAASLHSEMEVKEANKCRRKGDRELGEKRRATRGAKGQQTEKKKKKKAPECKGCDENREGVEAKELKQGAAENAEGTAVAVDKTIEGSKETCTRIKHIGSTGDAKGPVAAEDPDDRGDGSQDKEAKLSEKTAGDSDAFVSSIPLCDTPRTAGSTATVSNETRQLEPLVDRASLSTAAFMPKQTESRNARHVCDLDGESSESSVEEWGTIYKSASESGYDTEEENKAAPWSAICAVGIRVYSKDPGLELYTVMEDGELLEGGRHAKEQIHIDDAVSSAYQKR